jgi:hypothetical protein
MAEDWTEALDGEQLAHLARYFEERSCHPQNTKLPEITFCALLTEAAAQRVRVART